MTLQFSMELAAADSSPDAALFREQVSAGPSDVRVVVDGGCSPIRRFFEVGLWGR